LPGFLLASIFFWRNGPVVKPASIWHIDFLHITFRRVRSDPMTDCVHSAQINPPHRLLMGPGPINADPRVLRAMASQLIGQYDPVMTDYMNETMALYRQVFATQNRWTLLIDGTSRAGIEAILVSAIRPGDRVLVPVFGRFGHLLCESLTAVGRKCIPLKCRGARYLRRIALKTPFNVSGRACC